MKSLSCSLSVIKIFHEKKIFICFIQLLFLAIRKFIRLLIKIDIFMIFFTIKTWFDKILTKLLNTNDIEANWTHGMMSFISLNHISPSLIFFGTWSLYKALLLSGAWEWLFPVCSLINWWSCKILQITSSSQKLVLSWVQLSYIHTFCFSNLSKFHHLCPPGWMHCPLLLWFVLVIPL